MCLRAVLDAGPVAGLVRKMVLLGAGKGPGARVTCWRPGRNAGVMSPQLPRCSLAVSSRRRMAETVHRMPTGRDKPLMARAVREQKDRSCAGKTTERGAETCLTGCRKAVITNVARFRAPADPSCESEGIGDMHGQTAGRKRSRERGGVSNDEEQVPERVLRPRRAKAAPPRRHGRSLRVPHPASSPRSTGSGENAARRRCPGTARPYAG